MQIKKRKSNQGFTLVELIIVIIILGILAALAIPQFSASTDDAKKATLQGNLAVLRNAISLYYHQHNSVYPGAVDEADGTTAVKGTDAADALIAQLTKYTNAAGKTSDKQDADFPYGPYLVSMPTNPLSTTDVVTAGGEATVTVTLDEGDLKADGKTGWLASSKTGKIIANNDSYSDL
ncbi:MAG: prepilin-type N-terminal cleavage/methylation domain-containing protein [Candidatus Hydrogenedentes bacterium]|nr:prepilin-type N-terminal cleavage/methylation domain-containing protein [Candidatus Hydrogenedentota bacterium]